MGEDGASGEDLLRARGHHLCLTDTIFLVFHALSMLFPRQCGSLSQYFQDQVILFHALFKALGFFYALFKRGWFFFMLRSRQVCTCVHRFFFMPSSR